MSARLSPDDLKKIAPEVYKREFHDQRTKPAEPARPLRKVPPKPRTVPPSFWFAAAVALAHFALILYLLIKY